MKFILTAALLLSASFLRADVPALINYQGLLTDINGNVVSGSKTVGIAIFDAPTAGTQLYSEMIGTVAVQNGVYSFQFGNGGNSIVSASEFVGSTNGSTTIFQKALSSAPINNSLSVSDGTYSWTQTGGSSSPTTFTVSFDEPTKTVTAIYIGAPPVAGRAITASYQYSQVGIRGALTSGSPLWLQTTIDAVDQSPRERLVSVPFALNSATADVATSLAPQTKVLFVPLFVGRVFDPFYDPHALPLTVPFGTPGSGTVGSTEGMYAIPNTLNSIQSVTVKASGIFAGGTVQVRIISRNMLTGASSTVYSFNQSGVFAAEETMAVNLTLDWSTSTYIVEMDASTASTSNTNDKRLNYIKLQGN